MTQTQQRLLALQHANEARFQTARLCQQVRSAGSKGGAKAAARIVLAAESSVRFYNLLLAVPRLGDRTARRLLASSVISGSSRVNSPNVTAYRRQILAGLLLHWSEGSHAR